MKVTSAIVEFAGPGGMFSIHRLPRCRQLATGSPSAFPYSKLMHSLVWLADTVLYFFEKLTGYLEFLGMIMFIDEVSVARSNASMPKPREVTSSKKSVEAPVAII